MSWHIPSFTATSSGLSSGPVFGIKSSPTQPPPSHTEPQLVTCVLCPEPGLVPASLMSDHLMREHHEMAFQCAACKVRASSSI